MINSRPSVIPLLIIGSTLLVVVTLLLAAASTTASAAIHSNNKQKRRFALQLSPSDLSKSLAENYSSSSSKKTQKNNNKNNNKNDDMTKSGNSHDNDNNKNNHTGNGTDPLANITWSTLDGCNNPDGACTLQAYSDLPSHAYAAYRIPLHHGLSEPINIDVVVNLEAEAVCEEAVYVQWKLLHKPKLLPWKIPQGGDDDDDESNTPDLLRALLVLPLEKSLMCETQPDIQKTFKAVVPSAEHELFVIIQSRSISHESNSGGDVPPPSPYSNITTTTTDAPTTKYPSEHTPSPSNKQSTTANQKCAVNFYVNMQKTSTWKTYSQMLLLGTALIAFITPVAVIAFLMYSQSAEHQIFIMPLRRLMYVNVLMFFPSLIFFFVTKWVSTAVSKTYECGKKNKCISNCCCPRNRVKKRATTTTSSNSTNTRGSLDQSSMTNINAETPEQATTTTASSSTTQQQQTHQEEEEEIVCRICFENDEDEDLLQPCNCTGSSAYIHQTCLDKWRVQSSNQRVQRAASCEICLAPFRIPVSRTAVIKMVALRILFFFTFFISAYGIITISFAFEAFAIAPMTCTAPYENAFQGPLSDFQTYVVGALSYMVISFCIYIATQISWMIWFNVRTPLEADPRDANGDGNNANEEDLLAAERRRMEGNANNDRGNNNDNNNNNNEENNNNNNGNAAVVENNNHPEEEERQQLLDDRNSPREGNNNNNNNNEENVAPAAQNENNNNNNAVAENINNNNNERREIEQEQEQEVEEENPAAAIVANAQENEEDIPDHVRRIREYADRQRARPVSLFFHSWKVLFILLATLLWEFSLLVFICFYYKWLVYNHRSDFAWSWGIPFPVMIVVVMFVSFIIVLIVVIRALLLRCVRETGETNARERAAEAEEREHEREIAEEQQRQQQQPQNQNVNANDDNNEREAAAPRVAVD